MKYTYILIYILLAALLLTACGSGAAPEETGFAFTYSGTRIQINGEAGPVVAALGEPKSYTEEASCASDGLSKTYYYGSFYLLTYPMDGRDYVYSLWFVDDAVATEEGIRIGSTQAEVEAAYGAGGFDGTNTYVLTKADTKLTLILTGGIVSSIQYAAAV